MITDSTALILAGGESRRMGQDKAGMVFGDQTLLQTLVNKLQLQFANIMVSVKSERTDIVLPQVCDDPVHQGPLAGLVAGLAQMNTPWLFAVACDMPFITPTIIEYLAAQREECQAVVPVVQGHPQPLAAFYSASCFEAARACLNGTGKHSVRALLERLTVRYVDEAALRSIDPSLRSFFDLDTPQDVLLAMSKGKGKD